MSSMLTRLSSEQERIWLLEQLQPGSAVHNLPAAVELRGVLDLERLRSALQELVARHDGLRTAFYERDGSVGAAVSSSCEVELEVMDLSGSAGPGEGTQRALAARAGRPFDLARAPLLRASLLRLELEHHVLLLVTHELSWRAGAPRLVLELGRFYNGSEPEPREFASGGVKLDVAGDLAYWRRRLSGAPLIVDLPTDRVRPALQSFRGGRVERPVSAPTDPAVHLAAVGAVVSRYSGQTDIVVGTEVASPEGVPVMLPVRLELGDEPDFPELVHRAAAALEGARRHSAPGLARLIAELDPQRDLSRSPIFQVAVVFEGLDQPADWGSALTSRALPTATGTTPFDLAVRIRQNGDEATLTLDFATDLYDDDTAARLLGHVATLMQGGLSEPGTPYTLLPVLTDDERARMLVAWNETVTDYPSDRCLHELISSQAMRTPSATAVSMGSVAITYAELEAAANRLAHVLVDRGAGRGTLVGICLERSVELIVALVATLKTGAAYVPIDPAYPRERQTQMLHDAAAPILITTEALRERVADTEAIAIYLDRPAERDRIQAQQETPPEVRVESTDLAYVIYTSGSTGRPKGVEIAHRSVVNLMSYMRERPGLSDTDVVANLTTPAFDLSVPDLYLPLVVGARLAIIPSDATLDGESLAAELEAVGATFVQATPTTWRLLVESGWKGRPQLKIVCGGEAVPPGLVGDLLDRGASLWHMYGPTETTVWSSVLQLREERSVVPIGGPIANTSFFVLDERGQPVPWGVPGQLYIGGDGLAQGYRNLPALTAEKFVSDPFSGSGRLYATGDLVRHRPEGTLEFAGRIDHQVKLRGFRIELGEVETLLAEDPRVAAAAAIVREDEPGDRRLVAYVTASGGEVPSALELRRSLARQLPAYMVPSAVVRLDTLPTSANGKVDRAALPAPDDHRGEGERPYVQPRTPVEEIVAELWADLLGLRQVGVDDDFFELGGNSLLAMRFISRLAERLRVRLPLRSIFEQTSVGALTPGVVTALSADGDTARGDIAQRIERLSLVKRAVLERKLLIGRSPGRRERIPRRDPSLPAPLSFPQQRLWFLDRWSPGSPAYNAALPMLLRGSLDTEALRRSFDAVVERQEALRTVFILDGSAPVQQTLPQRPFELPVIELTETDSADREHRLGELCRELARRPFDLERDVMLRATLVRLAEDEHVLALEEHHIAFDGWSDAILFRELELLYEAFRSGTTPELPTLPIQYTDFAAWQRARADRGQLDEQVEWWRNQLVGVPATLRLPLDRERPPVQTFEGVHQQIELPQELADRVRDVSREESATPFMTLLAAFTALLYRVTGEEDIVIGTPIANRDRVEVEELIGFFSNTLALRVRLGGNPTFRELVRRVREVALGGYAHQEVPFERIVEAVRPVRDASANPLFQVNFRVQSTEPPTLRLPGIEVVPLTVDVGFARFDLALELQLRDTGIEGYFEYNVELFEPETVARVSDQFAALLTAALERPDASLLELRLPRADRPSSRSATAPGTARRRNADADDAGQLTPTMTS